MPLVRLERVTKRFRAGRGQVVHAVNDVSLEIGYGETVGLIGESGSGKSTLARLLLRLQVPDAGRVVFADQDLSALDQAGLRRMRAQMTVVFQEPYESLNPRMTIGSNVEEPLRIHGVPAHRDQRHALVSETLERVALPRGVAEKYPKELSGGQQQRVGIARAIVTRPKFIVLDEPTSSLDVSVQAHILELLAQLQRDLNLSYLFISHDIHTVEYISERVAVMYLGQILETGPTRSVFDASAHPYTKALLSSSLSADPDVSRPRFLLQGEIPSPTEIPSGCPLYGRCPVALDACAQARVPLSDVSPGHGVACIRVAGAARTMVGGS